MTIDPIVREALDVYAMQRTALATGIHSLEAVQGAEAALLSAVRTAHLQELRGETEEEALEKAVDAMDASNQPDSLCENGHKFELSCNACHRRDLRHLARAAAPLLLADKAREIEATRNDYGACYAAMCKAQDAHRVAEARVAALEGALKDLIARVDAVGNWGPLSPVTDTHRTLLDGGTR